MKLSFLSFGISICSVLAQVPDIGTKHEHEHELNPPKSPSFAACLLVMDDNSRLVEWLAYHYHVLPLRNLIVAVDPRSTESPASILHRWENLMSIELWDDRHIFNSEELGNRTEENLLYLHRTRQRAFNVNCMKHLREQGASWTIMTDTDEFIYTNPGIQEPDSPLYQEYNISKTTALEYSVEKPGSILQQIESHPILKKKTPCINIHRRQFGNIESSSLDVENMFPKKELAPLFQAQDFDTFRWRHHGLATGSAGARDGTIPGKTIIDLSRVGSDFDHLFVGDPHRPIYQVCNPFKVWIPESQSLFLLNHVLGSLEQYASRNDARLVDRILKYDVRKNVRGQVSDDARFWMKGFVDSIGEQEAQRLLAGAGASSVKPTNVAPCSINFFGLPRSFKTMVLPSLIKNVLLANAEYNCDIVVHYYKIDKEDVGRFNSGGVIDVESVKLLETVTQVVAAHKGTRPPNVVIKGETLQAFQDQYSSLVHKYQTEIDPTSGRLKYFPWVDKTYTMKQVENIVMQWGSIQSAWNEMEHQSSRLGVKYERVAFLRSDVFFATPIDIFQLDQSTYDYKNRNAIIPPFGKYPVSDRMIYGPANVVKIWATERFSRLDHHIANLDEAGRGIHPETFLGHEIFPVIEKETGVRVLENVDICFYRTRADDTVLISDCTDVRGGVTREFDQVNQTQLVEELLGRDCHEFSFDTERRFLGLRCDGKEITLMSRNKERRAQDALAPTRAPVIANPKKAKKGTGKKKNKKGKGKKKKKGQDPASSPSPNTSSPSLITGSPSTASPSEEITVKSDKKRRI